MIDISRVRSQVADVLRRFPSCTAAVQRPKLNDYGESTGETETILSEAAIWWAQPGQPNAVKADEKGTAYQMDNRKWACLIWDEALETVRRGDLVITGGRTYRLCNTETRLNIRVFWQLEEVSV